MKEYCDISVGSYLIGDGHPCFIIAEAGINHDGDIKKAIELVDIAVKANADAVKFQTFDSKKLASKDSTLASYHKKGLISTNETLRDLLKRLELSYNDTKEVFNYARDQRIEIFSTPFDEKSADFLFEMGVNVFKVASFSLTNYPLLEHISKKDLPIIMSTGLHSLGEIEEAMNIIRSTGNEQIILLQCTSHYPSDASDANLRAMSSLQKSFETHVGYSDHTMGINIPLAAVALGAKVIEKHFTFDENSFGVDHDASISPRELISLVHGIREVETSLGSSRKIIPKIEEEIQRVHRPSIVSRIEINKGTVITRDMLCIKKPGTGIHPKDIGWIIGSVAKQLIKQDRLISKKDIM